METAYWNDHHLKRRGKSSVESKDLSATCESFNSGNEINRKLKTITSIYFQKNLVSGHFAPKFQLATQGKLYFDEILHNH